MTQYKLIQWTQLAKANDSVCGLTQLDSVNAIDHGLIIHLVREYGYSDYYHVIIHVVLITPMLDKLGEGNPTEGLS